MSFTEWFFYKRGFYIFLWVLLNTIISLIIVQPAMTWIETHSIQIQERIK